MRIEECFSANHKNCRYNLYNNDRFTWANIHRKSVFISLHQFLCVLFHKKKQESLIQISSEKLIEFKLTNVFHLKKVI